MTLPNPVRTLKSHGVEDQTSEDWNAKKSCIGRPRNSDVPAEAYTHHMLSVKTWSTKVPYVEVCTDCGWIDGASLEWWADNAIKNSLNERARRIAVATETEPFAFVQGSDGDLDLTEILGQALGAASVCWVGGTGPLEFDSVRAARIFTALRGEIARQFDLERENAGTRLAQWMRNSFSDGTIAEARRIVEANERRRPGVKEWSDLAYELYALACNAQAAIELAEQTAAFERLKTRFHELLNELPKEERTR
jgi:hypothetical protein